MAIVGPQLAGIQPTDGDLLPLDGSGVRNIAPRDLTFRFDENQQIDPNTLNGVRIVRSGLDGDFSNGVVEVTAGLHRRRSGAQSERGDRPTGGDSSG